MCRCVVCNKEFTPRTHTHKSCSPECRKEYKKIHSKIYHRNKLNIIETEKECKICSSKFIGTNERVYCDNIECKKQGKNLSNKSKYVKKEKKIKEYVPKPIKVKKVKEVKIKLSKLSKIDKWNYLINKIFMGYLK